MNFEPFLRKSIKGDEFPWTDTDQNEIDRQLLVQTLNTSFYRYSSSSFGVMTCWQACGHVVVWCLHFIYSTQRMHNKIAISFELQIFSWEVLRPAVHSTDPHADSPWF